MSRECVKCGRVFEGKEEFDDHKNECAIQIKRQNGVVIGIIRLDEEDLTAHGFEQLAEFATRNNGDFIGTNFTISPLRKKIESGKVITRFMILGKVPK